MTNKITCISILTTPTGERLSYTYSILNDDGTMYRSNIKKSYVISDADTQSISDQLTAKVIANLEAV